MSNTERSKNLIAEAIKSLSNDFALSDARAMLTKALNEIQHIESKRARRENIDYKPTATTRFAESHVSKETTTARQSQPWTHEQILSTVSLIDKMIAEEKQKLEDLKKPKPVVEKARPTVDDAIDLLNG